MADHPDTPEYKAAKLAFMRDFCAAVERNVGGSERGKIGRIADKLCGESSADAGRKWRKWRAGVLPENFEAIARDAQKFGWIGPLRGIMRMETKEEFYARNAREAAEEERLNEIGDEEQLTWSLERAAALRTQAEGLLREASEIERFHAAADLSRICHSGYVTNKHFVLQAVIRNQKKQ